MPKGIYKNYESLKHGISELQAVDFEVTVGAETTKGSEGKLGVVNAFIGAGIAGNSSSEQAQTNTLKFRVPIQLPTSGELRS